MGKAIKYDGEKKRLYRLKSNKITLVLTFLLLLTALTLTYVPAARANGDETDTSPPTWSNMNNDSTSAGEASECSIEWQDDTELDFYVFGTNNTGYWENTTVPFEIGVDLAWANQTITLNSTVGALVQCRWYANDTSDNWGISDLLNITTTEPTDMMQDMAGMMGMLGMMTNLDIQVQTGVINLVTESATIYIQVTQGGIPTNVTKLNVTLIYDDPCNWTVEPPKHFGYWELRPYSEPDPFYDICNYTWADKNMDTIVDEDEKIYIPGLYIVTVCYGGFPPGDYLIWVYAEAPNSMFETFNMTELMGDGGMDESFNMEEMMTLRGVGIGGFTVSMDMSMMVLGFPELVTAFRQIGVQMGDMMGQLETVFQEMMASTEAMGGNLAGMVTYQEDMAGVIGSMTTKMESMLTFLDEMMVFQEDMGQNTADMLTFQMDMTERFQNFTQGLEEFNAGLDATKILIEDLKGEVSIVKADVGETISALPLLYQEASEIQALTAAGMPIAQLLSVIVVILSLASIAFLMRINRNTNGFLRKSK